MKPDNYQPKKLRYEGGFIAPFVIACSIIAGIAVMAGIYGL